MRCTRSWRAFLGPSRTFFTQLNPRWNLIGRVCFHLAENKNDEVRPFAFLATYTTQFAQGSATQHLPLRMRCKSMLERVIVIPCSLFLTPIQKAATQSPFIDDLVKKGAIFQAQAWTAHEAHRFLKDIPFMESFTVMCVFLPGGIFESRPDLG